MEPLIGDTAATRSGTCFASSNNAFNLLDLITVNLSWLLVPKKLVDVFLQLLHLLAGNKRLFPQNLLPHLPITYLKDAIPLHSDGTLPPSPPPASVCPLTSFSESLCDSSIFSIVNSA